MSQDLLKALLEAAAAQSGGQRPAQADPTADLLGSLLGGASPQSGAQASQGDPMADLLGSMLGSASAQSGAQSSQADPLAGLLGALLGGAAAPSQPDVQTTLNEAQPQAGADLGGLLGSLLGGAAAQQPAQPQASQAPPDLLSVLLGGGQPAAQSGSQLGGLGGILQPILTTLVQNLGLPPQIAQMVVTFALTTLLTGRVGGATAAAGSARPTRGRAQPQALDLGSLLGKLAGGQGVSTNYLRSTGMVQALSAQTGLDQRTATLSLQQVLGELGGVMASQSQGVEGESIGGSIIQG